MSPREPLPHRDAPHRTDAEKLRARAVASARREAMNRRAIRIRKSVAGGAVALFAAAFLGVYVQLASGHDPALDSASKRAATSSVSASAGSSAGSAESAAAKKRAEASSGSSSESSVGTGEASSSESETSTSTPSSVTTSQS